MRGPRQKAVVVIGSTGAVLLTVAVLTGCSGESAMNVQEAKRSVVSFVDKSASAADESWEWNIQRWVEPTGTAVDLVDSSCLGFQAA